MKKILLVLLTAVLTMPLVLNAQFTATFGTGTSATTTGGSAGAPMSYGGAYSWTQQIYRASEFTAANVPAGATIISISFYNATGATLMSDLRTYMGHCTNDYFSGTSDWVPYNTLTLVDSGDWNAPAGWFTIDLDNPFVWDGVSNLVLGVSFRGAHSDYSTNNPNCGYRYTSQGTGNNAHIRRFSTTLADCDPTNTAAANSVSINRPNLQITYILSGCPSFPPTVANIGPYSADLSWINFQQSAYSWDLMYGETGTFDTLTGGTMVTGLTDTTYELTGLTSATTYSVYMKSYCSSETSTWSAPRTFTTTAACPTPTSLILMSYTAEEATISWQPGATETGWEVACVPHGDPVGSGTPVYVSNSPYTFTNLTDNTQYDLYVRADCGNGENSFWSSPVTFTTDPYCTPPVNVTSEQVTGTSALIVWGSAPVGATGYTVGYSEAGMDNWTTFTSITGNSYMLAGLAPNTEYDVFVFSECVQGNVDTVFTSFETGCMAGGDPFTEGTITTYQLPLNNYYNYTFTQQIYLASEMGGAATIDSIAFDYAYSTPSTNKTNVTLYLGHTTQSTFSSASDYIPSTGLQQVYTGPLNCSQGWNTFVFSTPFQYNGTDNLVLVVDDNSGAYNSSTYVFRAHNAGANRTLHFYNDTYNPDPTNPTSSGASGYTTSNRSNVKFFIPCDNTITCVAPNVYVNDVTDNSVTVAWAPGNTENAWELEYQADGETSWTSEGAVTSPHIVLNLTADTKYHFRVRAVCGGGEYSGWASVTHRTSCTSIDLPYMENFESATASGSGNMITCWTRNTNYSSTAYPYTSSSQHNSGTYSVYFYGTSAYYSYLASPRIADNVQMNDIQVSFYAYKTSANYKIKVGVMSDPEDFNTFTAIGEFSPSATNTWEYFDVNTSNYLGNGRYIAFAIPNEITSYMYIDDIVIDHIPNCPHVSNISAPTAAITQTSAVVTWTPGGTETDWEVVYGPTGTISDPNDETPEYVSGTPSTTLSNLLPSTIYDVYVRAMCSSSDGSSWMQASFQTECGVVSTFPYTQNFNNQGSGSSAYPMCWSRYQTGTTTTYPYISTTGGGSLYFYSYSATTVYGATDPMNLSNETPGMLALSFDVYKSSASYGRLDVGYMTDEANESTFHVLKSIYPGDLTSTSTWYPFTVNIPASVYNLSEVYFAFKAPISSNSNYVYIDNVKVDYLPECSAPSNFAVTNVAGTSALLTWTEAPYGVADYTIEYGEANTGFYQSQVVTGSQFMLSGLTELTTYEAMIYSNCSSGPSDTLTVTFATTCAVGGDKIVGNGTTGTYNVPINTYYNYSYVQELFLANEINASGDISSIGFQYIYSTPQTKTNQSIYLAETDLTSLSNWIPSDSLTLVYQGSITYNNSGPDNWVNIPLTTPFNYSGNRNLVVVIKNDHGSYSTSSNNTFNAHSASGMTLHYYDDDNAFSFTSPESPETYSFRNNVRFGMDCDMTVTCIAPNVYVQSFDATSATIAWAPGASETSWEMEYKAEGDASWTSVGTVTTSPYVLTGLTSSTTYTIRLRSLCGSDNSAWSTTSVTIPCFITTLPFMENFDNATGSGSTNTVPCWTKMTNYSTAYPYPSSTYAHSPNYSLYFYGTSAYYSMAVSPRFDDAIEMDSLQITFWSYKSSASYFIEVGILSDLNNPNSFEPIGTFSPSATSTWEKGEFTTNGYQGNGHYVAFRIPQWITSYQYLDDVTIDYIPACVHVEDITASNITQTSADITWTPGSSETSWEVLYGENVDFSTDVPSTESTNSISLTGLTPNTLYYVYVRGICDGGDYSSWEMYTFRTECGSIVNLPYTEDFDSYGTGTTVYPACWGRINTYTSGDRPYVNSTHYAGVGSLYFYATSTTYNIAIAPQIDSTIPVNGLMVNFMYRASSSSDRLIVGVMTNPTNANTFVPIDTVHPGSSATAWVEREVYLSSYTGTGQYIAFYNGNPSSTCYSYIDNLMIDYLPTCPKPTQVHATGVSTTSIDLAWTENGSATEWEIEYGPTGFTLGSGTVESATSNPYTVSYLTPSTQYDFYVRAVCGAGDSSYFAPVYTVATACDPIDQLPYTENFDSTTGASTTSVANNNLPYCWSHLNNGSSSSYSGYPIVYTSATYAASGNNSMRFYTYTTSGTYDDQIAILPAFDPVLYPINTLQLSFDARNNSSYTFKLVVGVMSNPTDKTTFVPIDTIITISNTYTTYDFPLNHYTGTGNYIAIMAPQPTSSYNAGYVDNIVVDLIPSCPRPNDLHAVDATTSSIELGWTEMGSATTWEIAYGAPGFDPDAAGTSTVTVTTNPFTVSGLNNSTTYEFYVRALCSGTDISNWSSSASAATTMVAVGLPYTADFSANDAWVLNNGSCPNYWMKGTVSNEPALFVTSNGSTPEYTNNNSAVAALKLFTVGTADSITITFDIMVDGEGSYDYFKLFLTPPTQQFPASTTSPSSGDYWYNDYSVNAYNFYANSYGTQSSHAYILNKLTATTHVVAKMPNPNANPNANSSALLALVWKNDGSVLYNPPATITNLTVTAGGGTAVTNPTVATNDATAIAETSATLNAAITNPDNVTITAKGFEWKATTGGTYTQVTGTGTGNNFSYNLTGLTPNTSYTFKAFITYNGTTVYGTEKTFTTLDQGTEPCNVPTGLAATDIQGESITITWDNDPNVSSWNVQYRPEGGQLSTASTQTNSYTLTGLTNSTTYQIQVQANCGDGNLSDWTQAINVTTTGIENWLDNSVALYPNPAKEYVDIRVNGDLNVTMMEVYDVYGKLINTVNVVENPTRINVSNLADGMYFVRVTTEAGMVTKTFVKK